MITLIRLSLIHIFPRGYVRQHRDHSDAAQSQQGKDLVVVSGIDGQFIAAPVSYTHLDVYKRQTLFWGTELPERSCAATRPKP